MINYTFKDKIYTDISRESQYALAAANVHTFRFFPKDRVWMASDLSTEYFGIDKFYEIGSDPSSGPKVIYPKDAAKDWELYRRVIGGEDHVSGILRSYDGQKHYHLTLACLEKDSDGDVTIIGGVIEDYDDSVLQMQFMEMLSSDYQSVFSVDFELDQVTAFRLNDYTGNKYGNAFLTKPSYYAIMSQYINEDVIDEERDDMRIITSFEHFSNIFATKKSFHHDYRVMRDGRPHYFRIKVVNVSETPNKVTNVVIGFSDIDQDRQNEWNHFAYYDQITLGNNFNYFSERLKSESDNGYIVSMDIHSFKMVNEVCGIRRGDYVLQRIAEIVDLVIGDSGYYGHVNADHFAFFISSEDENKVIQLMNEIYTAINNLVEVESIPHINPYFGATAWNPGDRIQVKFSEANTAKHRIKDSKDLIYGFYREEDIAAAIEEKRIEDAFDGAVANREFEVWYQPKYSPDKAELVGAEALVRWRKPDGSLFSPGKFIPVFEKTGIIRLLDEYVFTTVCKQQREWIDTLGHTIPVSINLSRASLYHDTIVEDYSDIASTIGVEPKLLPIEITESAAIDNADIKALADSFYNAGFPLHIDDFGSGYSSLSTLNMMKFDTLKLDKSLIDYIGEFGGDRLIKHTVALAKDLGLQVTAEGVERQEQADFLLSVDCDNIQGFLFAKPMVVSEFTEHLKTEKLAD